MDFHFRILMKVSFSEVFSTLLRLWKLFLNLQNHYYPLKSLSLPLKSAFSVPNWCSFVCDAALLNDLCLPPRSLSPIYKSIQGKESAPLQLFCIILYKFVIRKMRDTFQCLSITVHLNNKILIWPGETLMTQNSALCKWLALCSIVW